MLLDQHTLADDVWALRAWEAFKHISTIDQNGRSRTWPVELTKVEVIVVEEAFLFNAVLWTLMDVILRGVRALLQSGTKQKLVLEKSFGGVALMVVGDPLQGSPIGDDDVCLNGKSTFEQ